MYNTLAQIKKANRAIGHHFFDAATLRYWRSEIAPDLINGRYFVTSEQCILSDGEAFPRLYTIRRANDDGSISTGDGFQKFDTLQDALDAAAAL